MDWLGSTGSWGRSGIGGAAMAAHTCVFDTAFHATLPKFARIKGLPRDIAGHEIRRKAGLPKSAPQAETASRVHVAPQPEAACRPLPA
jgi:hypothetical protein